MIGIQPFLVISYFATKLNNNGQQYTFLQTADTAYMLTLRSLWSVDVHIGE
jgi:hypothetical protein